MDKFNKPKESRIKKTKKKNYEGGEAFRPATPQMGLYKVVINNLVEDKFYTDKDTSIDKLKNRFDKCAEENPEFILKLAAYARQEMYLREVPQVLLVMSAHDERTKHYVPEYANDIIDRADEINETFAIKEALYGMDSVPRKLKQAVNKAFHKFDRYQFAKYNRTHKQWKFRDVMNLTHPKPQDEEEEIFASIIKGPLDDHPDVEPLEPPKTWEVVISERGNNKDAWEEVLPKMGMFARLRNIRNMLECGIDGEEIFDEENLEYIDKAKLYPFRFYQAYRAMKDAQLHDRHLEDWLSDAINKASENIPDELRDTFVAVDLSGSMDSRLSSKSTLTYREISALFGAIFMRKGTRVGAFGTGFDTVQAHYRTPTLELQDKILTCGVGGSTNGWKAIKYLVENSIDVDRIVMLTDMQIWDSTGFNQTETVREWFNEYRDEVSAETRLYMLDLSSYGDLVTPEGKQGVYNISGWNSKIIDFIQYAERPGEIVREIKEISP